MKFQQMSRHEIIRRLSSLTKTSVRS